MIRYTVCVAEGCAELVEVGIGRCPAHVRPAWQNPSQHTVQRPPDWSARRLACLKRDGFVCRWLMPGGRRCARRARFADHVVPVSEGGSWEVVNLQSLCDHHNDEKNANDAARRRMKRYAGT